MPPDLDAEKLIANAIDKTGLDDFGEGPWRDGLDVIVDALNSDAALNDIGAITWDATLGSLLRNRLEVEETYRLHPEIAELDMPAPIWIVGVPRTGTTALSSLLARDDRLRPLLTWEAVQPCPPPQTATRDSDPRIEAIATRIGLMEQVDPEIVTMHDTDPTGPTENHDLHGMTFRTQAFDGLARVPSYLDWWLGQDLRPAFEYQARTARLLQWKCLPNRWHFKSPPDLFALDVIRAVHPEARIVWTHRDPTKSIPSISSFEAHLWKMNSDDVRFSDVGPHLVRVWEEGTRRGMELRDSLPTDTVFDVAFSEFRRDQLAVVRGLYDWLGIELTDRAEQRMRSWLDENPQGKHGRHAYSLEEFGLTDAGVRDAMGAYIERFADHLV